MSLLFKFPYWEILKRCRRLSSKVNFPESQHTHNWALASLPAKLLALQNTMKPNRPVFCFLYFARLLLLIFSYTLPVFCFLYFASYILFKNRYLKYNQLKPRQISPVQSYIFSCPEQLNRWPLSVCLSDPTNNQSLHNTSERPDLWPVRHLISQTFDEWFPQFSKIFRFLGDNNSNKDNPRICDTDYNSDNWEPEFMTIFVIWQ